MTNFDIIVNDAIRNEIYTEDQAKAIIQANGELPLHTFSEWKRRGYSVKKGEHAKLTSFLWKFKKELVKIPQKDGEEVEEEAETYYKVKSFLFSAEQVQKIEAIA